MAEENLPLVHFVAKRFRDRGAEYEDLVQYGCIGLLKAIDRFDSSYGVRFSTYAVPIIMGEIRCYLRDDGPVHISRTIHDNAMRVERFRENYVRERGREPTFDEISEAEKLSKEDVLLAINAGHRVRSLNEPVNGEGTLRLMDVIGEESMNRIDARIMLKKLLMELEPEERTVIIRRYFHSQTQSAIAVDLGVSQVQVSRMEGRIIRQLRARAQGEN